jgi:2-phosphoglycerate kinase
MPRLGPPATLVPPSDASSSPHTRTVAAIVSDALEIVVAHHVATALPVLIEGDTILPALAAQRTFAGLAVSSEVRAVFLVESDPAQLRQNTLDRSRGAEAMPARELEAHLSFSWQYGHWLAREAVALSLPVVQVRPYPTVLARTLRAFGLDGG